YGQQRDEKPLVGRPFGFHCEPCSTSSWKQSGADGEDAMQREARPALVTLAWLAAVLSIGPASAQRCDGVEVEIGATERRCLKPGAAQSFKDCPDCPEMVMIPAGSFTM